METIGVTGKLIFYFLDDFFINLCIIITLIVVYLLFRSKLNMDQIPRWQSGVIDGMTGGLFGFILMVFSIEIAENALIDLHFIPIMLLILFGETFSAVIGSFLIIIGRFILGEITSFAMTTPVLIIALLAGFLLFHKLYQPNQVSYFKSLIMILFSNIVFIAMMMIHFNAFFQLLRFVPVYGVVSIVGGLTAFFCTVSHQSSIPFLKVSGRDTN